MTYTLLFLERDGLRQGRQHGIAETLAQAWDVDSIPFDRKAAPNYGVAAWSKAHGRAPDATCSWEEHGRQFWHPTMADYVRWAVAQGIAPLHIDLGHLDHRRAYIVDRYRPDGRTLVDEDWPSFPDTAPDWTACDPRLSRYRDGALSNLELAKRMEPVRPPGYVVFWTQCSTHLSRLKNTWPCLVNDVARRIAPLRLIVKTGPCRPRGWEGIEKTAGVEVTRHDKADPLQNARLALGAEYSVIVTSSVVNELVLWGLPVASLGDGRFRDKGVFHEVMSWREFTPAFRPPVHEAGRNRYLNWWLANSAYRNQLSERYAAVIERTRRDLMRPVSARAPSSAVPAGKAGAASALQNDVASGEASREEQAITTVTTVYVADERSERVTFECLAAVAREFPESPRIAAVDLAPPAAVERMKGLGFEVVTVDGGKPPRMNRLLGAAVEAARTPFVLTVESDVILKPGAGVGFRALLGVFDESADIGAIEAVTVDENGKPKHPVSDRLRANPPVYGERAGMRLRLDPRFPTFCGVCFRRADMLKINWAKCRALAWCDKDSWTQLPNRKALIAQGVTAFHYRQVARQAARARASAEPRPEESAMHKSSFSEMRRLLRVHRGGAEWTQPLRVLDVGSMSVNKNFPHTYREHMAPAWTYRGCDLAPGKNVDFVMAGPYMIQERGDDYDVVISGQCLEHVQLPWMLVQEMARVCKPSGLLILTVPWNQQIHRYPLDCWRILPDGWRALAAWVGLDVEQAYTNERDSWLVARKRKDANS